MEQVRLICGKLQGNNVLRFWKVEDVNIDTHIGNYAIVENLDSYALVEILGLTVTTKDKIVNITTTKYENMKRMVKEIDINELTKEQNNG